MLNLVLRRIIKIKISIKIEQPNKTLTQKANNFKALEEIIHPLVRDEEWQFLKNAKSGGAKMAVIDIPLLFETGSNEMMDVTVLASAPAEIQRRRALERPGMTLSIPDVSAGELASRLSNPLPPEQAISATPAAMRALLHGSSRLERVRQARLAGKGLAGRAGALALLCHRLNPSPRRPSNGRNLR